MAVTSIAVVVFLSLGLVFVHCNDVCLFSELAGKKGSDTFWKNGKNTTDKAGCKAHCTSDEHCVAAEFGHANTDCFLYYTPQNLSDATPSITFIGKLCVTVPDPGQRAGGSKPVLTLYQVVCMMVLLMLCP